MSKEKEKLIRFLEWMNKTTQETPMRLETNHEDIAMMFLSQDSHAPSDTGEKMSAEERKRIFDRMLMYLHWRGKSDQIVRGRVEKLLSIVESELDKRKPFDSNHCLQQAKKEGEKEAVMFHRFMDTSEYVSEYWKNKRIFPDMNNSHNEKINQWYIELFHSPEYKAWKETNK